MVWLRRGSWRGRRKAKNEGVRDNCLVERPGETGEGDNSWEGERGLRRKEESLVKIGRAADEKERERERVSESEL